MADIAEQVADLITTTTLPVQVGSLPASIEECIGIRLNDGAAPTIFFGQQEVIQYPLIQITLRSKAYSTGSTDAKTICDLLNNYHDTDILGITQIGDVMHLGRDTNNLHEFHINFRVMLSS